MAWDLNICMDKNEKVLVPFHYFVHPRSQLSRSTPYENFPFLRLPYDLQLEVYDHCDLPTLFQLMRTCSSTRSPATKLFWANMSGTHWYHCSEHKLFKYGSAHIPVIEHCPDFARRITRIELQLYELEYHFAAEDEDGSDRHTAASTTTKAKEFWMRMERAFPAVRRVVLTGTVPPRPLPPPPGEFDEAYTIIETVIESCPTHIVAQVAFDDGDDPNQRFTLWQVAKNTGSTWQVIDEKWSPTRILLPPRNWPASPLGDLVRLELQCHILHLEKFGLDWLKMESHVRYPLDGAIHCPRSDCDATFAERSQWKRHLLKVGHCRLEYHHGWIKDERGLSVSRATPVGEQAALEARRRRMDDTRRQALELQRYVGRCWGKKGTEQRQVFEEQLFAQLREENFAAPGELYMGLDMGLEYPGNEWIGSLHDYFDRTYASYVGEWGWID
jgi:hypothetical protein